MVEVIDASSRKGPNQQKDPKGNWILTCIDNQEDERMNDERDQ
jgi:hypothetical protein